MNIQDMLTKAQDEALTNEERAFIFEELGKEIEQLKKEHPDTYLQILDTLKTELAGINTTLKELLDS
jgi:3-methyladenine DNA glycosylase AlkC